MIASVTSPSKNTKIEKLSHDHQHHPKAEIGTLTEIPRTTITICKTVTVLDVVEQRDIKLECRRSRNLVCNKCNIKGHFTSMCKTKSTPRNTHTHTQHMRPTRNIHQVADNTDFDNYIELPLVLGNNSEFEEDIYLFRIKGQSSTYNIAKSQPLQFSSHHRLQVSTEYS